MARRLQSLTGYYSIRNHLVDFLVNRSKLIQAGAADSAPDKPPVVEPGLQAAPEPRHASAIGGPVVRLTRVV